MYINPAFDPVAEGIAKEFKAAVETTHLQYKAIKSICVEMIQHLNSTCESVVDVSSDHLPQLSICPPSCTESLNILPTLP